MKLKQLAIFAACSVGIVAAAQANPFGSTQVSVTAQPSTLLNPITQTNQTLTDIYDYLTKPLQQGKDNWLLGAFFAGLNQEPSYSGFLSNMVINLSSSYPVQHPLPISPPQNSPQWFIQDALLLNQYGNGLYKDYSQSTDDKITLDMPISSGSPGNSKAKYQSTPTAQILFNLIAASTPSPDLESTISDSLAQIATGQTTAKFKQKNAVSDYISNQLHNLSESSDLLPSLNADTFISPLMYTNQNNGGNGKMPQSNLTTLQAQSQQQAASNFVRHLAGEFIPLPEQNSRTLTNAFNNNVAGVVNYFNSLRGFIAQVSVGISNLNYLYGKRMSPENGSSDNTPTVSQSAYEFQMATQRLQNPNTGDSQQNNGWAAGLDKLTPREAQREMLMLLAEMNYQLYLNRQVQERMLLTMSAQQLHLLNTIKSSITLQQAGSNN